MKKHIGLLIAFVSVFLIGASGVSAKTITLDSTWNGISEIEIDETRFSDYLDYPTYVFVDSDNSDKLSVFMTKSDTGFYVNSSNNLETVGGFSFFYVDSSGNISCGSTCYYGSAWGKSINNFTFYYASQNILDSNGNVFYQPPSRAQMFPGIVEAILKPVIQIVIGLIPLVIGLVVFCLALRKGLQLLLKTLRQA